MAERKQMTKEDLMELVKTLSTEQLYQLRDFLKTLHRNG